jgi:hypothetical protein
MPKLHTHRSHGSLESAAMGAMCRSIEIAAFGIESRIVALVAIGFLLVVVPVRAQSGQPPPPVEPAEQTSADDPLKAVFFSLRNEYANQFDGAWSDAFILRSDRAWLKRNPLGGKVGLLTRIDVPFVTVYTSGATQPGLGDVYAQALHVPWLTPHFALGMGSGVTFPTATDQALGLGKWQVAPILAPIWFFPAGKGFLLIRLHEHLSFAGDATRPDVNYLQTTPTVVYNFRRHWWVTLDTEATTDWQRDNRVSFRSGVELGHVVLGQFGISVKPEIPWGVNRSGDWTVKVVLTRYRLRSS